MLKLLPTSQFYVSGEIINGFRRHIACVHAGERQHVDDPPTNSPHDVGESVLLRFPDKYDLNLFAFIQVILWLLLKCCVVMLQITLCAPTAQVPFPLTLNFKEMTQRGIELSVCAGGGR